MRIGLIGLSTPLAYDYGVEASRTPADLVSSPNPLLDSAFGLMLLYDELWFLCRSLCPENMRSLEFVRFLDEEAMLPDLAGLDTHTLMKDRASDFAALTEGLANRLYGFGEAAGALPLHWNARPDNHTHRLRLGSLTIVANSAAPATVLFDLAVLDRLGRKDVELIGNTLGQTVMEGESPMVSAADLAHTLVIENIPNYLSRTGPFHPIVLEARDDRFLKHFRRWVSTTAPTSPAEAEKIKREVEDGLRRAQEELFLQRLDRSTQYFTLGKTVVGVVGDLIVPYVGTAATVINDVREARAVRDQRWQGFLVSFGREAREQASRVDPGDVGLD